MREMIYETISEPVLMSWTELQNHRFKHLMLHSKTFLKASALIRPCMKSSLELWPSGERLPEQLWRVAT